MNVRPEILGLIVACMVVTQLPRVLPLLAARRLRLPPLAIAWLGYVPVAVISALFFGEVLLADGGLPTSPIDARLLAGMATLVISFATRNIMVTVIGGMASYAVLQAVLASA